MGKLLLVRKMSMMMRKVVLVSGCDLTWEAEVVVVGCGCHKGENGVGHTG